MIAKNGKFARNQRSTRPLDRLARSPLLQIAQALFDAPVAILVVWMLILQI